MVFEYFKSVPRYAMTLYSIHFFAKKDVVKDVPYSTEF
jgi:hypothetical protein